MNFIILAILVGLVIGIAVLVATLFKGKDEEKTLQKLFFKSFKED